MPPRRFTQMSRGQRPRWGRR